MTHCIIYNGDGILRALYRYGVYNNKVRIFRIY